MITPTSARSSEPARPVRGLPAGVLGLLVVAVVTAALALAPRLPAGGVAPTSPSLGTAVAWRDAEHSWLLVTDRSAHQLVIYDATSGRPLRRIGAGHGVERIDTITVRGNRLLLQDGTAGASRMLSLPELQPQAVASR